MIKHWIQAGLQHTPNVIKSLIRPLCGLLVALMISPDLLGQAQGHEAIATMVRNYKTEARGPYSDIRWFCKDGSIVLPQERCPQPDGVQRARYRNEVIALGRTNHIFLGQILSTTPFQDVWDEAFHQSRLKQYQLEQFLKASDNGWVNRRAQFYRGAYQAEDEAAWGIKFYEWLLSDKQRITTHFFLIRQSAKDLPHAADNNLAQQIRAISKELADQYAPFMDLRVKLHGQPEKSDIQRVQDFRGRHANKMNAQQQEKLALLLRTMETYYNPDDLAALRVLRKKLPVSLKADTLLKEFMEQYGAANSAQQRCVYLAETSMAIRHELSSPMRSSARLALLDASIRMETMLIQQVPGWTPITLRQQMAKVRCLIQAAGGLGYLEPWEWEQLDQGMAWPAGDSISLLRLSEHLERARRAVEWGTSMARATYQDVLNLYTPFEPLAQGFVDDKVRASILLPLGSSVSALGDFFAGQAGFSNAVLGIPNQSSMRGLNPGYASGELVVTDHSAEEISVQQNKIYVFDRPPADLNPVAGIATVSEGNMVSHVQLLARNLGIPNAVLSKENLNALMAFSGTPIFYAVSNKGTVVMKPAAEMNAMERALFTKQARSEERIRVPVENMELKDPRVLNMREVNAASSGKICGPKAANLGQLKQLFPEHVVEGLVVPFSIFRQHFDQAMPDQGMTYWEFLNQTFGESASMQEAGQSEEAVEKYVLQRLEILRTAIKSMPLDPDFRADLAAQFVAVFGKAMGQIPVFLRSDTNMEDLKDFTGAGLNLTLFNVLDEKLILQGIKDVWASPYTERSYRWRQRYLLNPENVFPSILIIPSVDADRSGVMITKGVSTGLNDDVTVAFNRGVGGAVEGQASESWLLRANGANELLSPAREPEFTSIPATGGTQKKSTTFSNRLLDAKALEALRNMAAGLKTKLGEMGMQGPYDVELGFKDDRIWLFQVRPFVENKKALASEYLLSITPKLVETRMIALDTPL